tara:strand:+ start:418 stop:708 length:291 start_codon:yes stop_codon:yes gene_type:complete
MKKILIMRSRASYEDMYFKSPQDAWKWIQKENLELIDWDTYNKHSEYSSKFFNGKTIGKNTFLNRFKESGTVSFILKHSEYEIHFLDIEDEFWGNY